jgi:hypothetical protein
MNDNNDQFDLPEVTSDGYQQASLSDPVVTFSTDDATYSQGDDNRSQQQSIVGSISIPEEANDLDLIEKEWVLKAKQIVAHTYEDPYTQQAEISKMKADYMKKRYGKDIKIAESR